ncbi:TPA: LysR substrate-binding domain-containing protein [Providencia alcalifaciens]|uniref:LysR family transcriptional regulator n=3 Tax=Providencia alcalifaciens TaxID=126385 RepID=A0AAW9V9F0_9GAMM|nr:MULTISPECIES: LysR substrate-binding domain-containing protein [Providencia]EKT66510.1 LysR family transcriptional regulator [Providencia alcalifaciens Dmel2]ETT03865.1 LysR substrate-binding domain protein [Providencia alcalifaciens F90-2004]EUC95096.1 LysR substrate-binding domain protein [Providencia alcalifaciens PAL-2]EUD03767.1 LysR substrate-binding domain protein [Providencia alcalifaciens RIMD 1656011]EUD08333.1 LysR substrate-binding domain protein [Providencia alcalifaciens R90-1
MKATSDEAHVFIEVVEQKSFTKAADKLNIANSAVSRTVKKLEEKLGVNLLKRTTRQIDLTAEGELYFQRMKNVLQEMQTIEDELLDTQSSPKGLLRIDAATPVTLHLLIPFVAIFRQQYPNIELSLVSSETFVNLIERKVDIAIRAGQLADSSLRARPLFNSYRKIVASPRYIETAEKITSVADLRHHTCLTFTEPTSLNTWPVNTENGLLIDVADGISSNSGETLLQLCVNGEGIACLSDFMVNEGIKRGELIELLPDEILPIPLPFHAVYYSDKVVSQRIRAFIDCLTTYLDQIGKP